MKKLSFSAIMLLLSAGSLHAQTVYECPLPGGKTEYRADFRQGCTAAKLQKIEGYTSESTSTYTPYDEPTYDGVSENAAAAPSSPNSAAQELAAAERALEEGKAVRYGNERNYAKYQERIQKLEDDVARAREKVAGQTH
ncbi:MAG: hypothetical protein Q4G42_02580 [Neisseria sp.]|nr:hypothetical protein [Neisseria sp.]